MHEYYGRDKGGKKRKKMQVRWILPKYLLMCAILYENDEEKSAWYEFLRL